MDRSGFLLINKPKDLSSYDCIRHLKHIIKKRIKIGHSGTLDTFATGLLIIAIGRDATKKIPLFLNKDKEYIASGRLGELTDTLDLTGKIIEKKDVKIVKKDLEKIIKSFQGNYNQTPPIYSALKYKGKALYYLARNNKLSDAQLEQIIKDKTREITIHDINLVDFNYPVFTIQTTVSKGTYIRSLVNDVANKLGSIATCYELTRTKIGSILLEKAANLNDIKTLDDIINNLISFENL